MQILILKGKIQESKGLPADTLKIVFKGKTVNNEDTIEKLAIKETDFIVVMAQVAVLTSSCRNRLPKPRRKASHKLPNKRRRRKKRKKKRRKRTNQKLPSLNLPNSLLSSRRMRLKSLNSCRWDSEENSVSRHSEQPLITSKEQ